MSEERCRHIADEFRSLTNEKSDLDKRHEIAGKLLNELRGIAFTSNEFIRLWIDFDSALEAADRLNAARRPSSGERRGFDAFINPIHFRFEDAYLAAIKWFRTRNYPGFPEPRTDRWAFHTLMALAALVEKEADKLAQQQAPAQPSPSTTSGMAAVLSMEMVEGVRIAIDFISSRGMTIPYAPEARSAITNLRESLRRMNPTMELPTVKFESVGEVQRLMNAWHDGIASICKDVRPIVSPEPILNWMNYLNAANGSDQKKLPQGNSASIISKDHQDEILQALLELKAFDKDSRQSTPHIANKALPPHSDPALLKRPLSDLKKAKLVETKGGRTGGAWLTPAGKATAIDLSK